RCPPRPAVGEAWLPFVANVGADRRRHEKFSRPRVATVEADVIPPLDRKLHVIGRRGVDWGCYRGRGARSGEEPAAERPDDPEVGELRSGVPDPDPPPHDRSVDG